MKRWIVLLRGSRSFVSLEQYRQFMGEVVMRLNARIGRAFAVERAALRALPRRRTADYEKLPRASASLAPSACTGCCTVRSRA